MTDDPKRLKKIIFADTDGEAAKRFEKYAKKDPLPKVPPALLNSTDIFDYVALTGMIFPFHSDPIKKKLKTASYEVDLLGEIIYWDENGIKKTRTLKKGDPFTLYKNSIAFVTPEPTFRLPDYIAIRFNLKIANVHRGILLGTGPLVDPGYEGKLLIPLHNLTNNDYLFVGGEGIIWMEFTKLSPTINFDKSDEEYERSVLNTEFPEINKKLGMEALIARALKGQEASIIQSSIPAVAGKAKKEAEKARTEAEQAKGAVIAIKARITNLSMVAVIALFLTLAGIITAIIIGNRQFINIGQDNIKQIEQLKQEVKYLNKRMDDISSSLAKSNLKSAPSKSENEKRN